MVRMYELQTKAAILDRMLAATPADLDKRQGSITYDLLSPAAIELAHVYIELGQLFKFSFAGPDQPSEYLDRRAAELGVSRNPSVKAEGQLTFNGDEGKVIPMGTVVSTDEETPVLFVTIDPGIIVQGKAVVRAFAVQGGSSGNVGAGRIRLVRGHDSGILAVNNVRAFTNGADEESDGSLLGRYFDRVRRPATSGNVWHYRQWALEVRGVGDVKVFPVWNGNGTVKLAVLSADRRAPGATIIDQVKQAVEERRPVGALVTVDAADEVAINVTARLKLAPGAELAQVKELFVSKLHDYFKELAFRSQTVPYNRIFGLLLDIETVTDFSDLQINGSSGNLGLAEDQVAVAGKVNFSVT